MRARGKGVLLTIDFHDSIRAFTHVGDRIKEVFERTGEGRDEDSSDVARPVDIEGLREGGTLTLSKSVPPPLVRAMTGHVIRDDVDERSHVVRVEFNEERLKLLRGAEVRIQFCGIDDVVAVGTAGNGLQYW
jgi:hypothetical protein